MSRFDDALDLIFALEGRVLTNVPGDRGGLTNHGVTYVTYVSFCQITGRIPSRLGFECLDEALGREIYRLMFWDAVRGDALPPPVAVVVFDAAVHSGPQRAIRLLQEVVGAKVDGILGKETLAAVQAMSAYDIAKDYLYVRHSLLMRLADAPNQGQFRKGWTNRIVKVRAFVQAMEKNDGTIRV